MKHTFTKERIKYVIKALALGMFIFSSTVSYAHTLENEIIISDSKEKENVEKNITNVKAMYNPVAEQFIVSFKLSKQSTVVVKLMDALGNEVASLLNSSLEEGYQSHSFEKSEKVTAGFYFIKVNSGSESVVKRIAIR